jgi:hypothetical protein
MNPLRRSERGISAKENNVRTEFPTDGVSQDAVLLRANSILNVTLAA